MSMPLARRYTADDVRTLPDDGNRYEVVHGVLLVTPAPGGFHQRVIGRLHLALGNYLGEHNVEDLLASPADISFDDGTLVQPDLFVADCAAFNRTGDWRDLRTLSLAIEVVSPSSARADRGVKRRWYQEQRVAEYWVVDIDQRQIEIWAPDARVSVIARETVHWRHPAIAKECSIDVRRLFTFP